MTVSWSANFPVASGEFGIWAVSAQGAGGWFVGDTVPANGASANYTHNICRSTCPVNTGYSITIYYRTTAGSGPWLSGALGPGTFDVTAGSVAPISITAPTGTGTYVGRSYVTVSWSANFPVASGEFGIWAVTARGAGGWFMGDTVPANGASANYTHNLPLNVPVDTGYSITIYYRTTAGSGPWLSGALGPGTFDVTP